MDLETPSSQVSAKLYTPLILGDQSTPSPNVRSSFAARFMNHDRHIDLQAAGGRQQRQFFPINVPAYAAFSLIFSVSALGEVGY